MRPRYSGLDARLPRLPGRCARLHAGTSAPAAAREAQKLASLVAARWKDGVIDQPEHVDGSGHSRLLRSL